MPTTYEVVERPPSGGVNEKGERHYTRSFKVVSSDPLDGPARIARQVPYDLYESYPYAGEDDPDAILKRVNVRPTDDLGVWEVELEYDSAPNAVDKGATRPSAGNQPDPGRSPDHAGSASQQTPPEQRAWVVKWGSTKTTKVLAYDYSDPPKVVATSAGQLYDPPIETPSSNATMSITAYASIFQPLNVLYWMDRVNSRTFMGAAKDCVRVINYGGSSQYENGKFFWQIEVELEFKMDGWNPVRVLDAGTMSNVDLGGEGKKFRPIKDEHGQPVTAPVPLDGFGGPLKYVAGQPPPAFVYNEFVGYLRGDMRLLLSQTRKFKKKDFEYPRVNAAAGVLAGIAAGAAGGAGG